MNRLIASLGVVGVIGLFGVQSAMAGSSGSFPGNPADMYITSDTANEVYQYQRSSPWPYVPGTYAGIAKPQVFTNQGQLAGGTGLYLGTVAGINQDFYLGAVNGLTRIDSNTGAFVQTIATGTRWGPATAPNGNIAVGGPTGLEEFTPTGTFVRNINNYGDGFNIMAFSGANMFVTNWAGTGPTTIKQYNFGSGLSSGADINVPFHPQKLVIGPDTALYASALYESPSYEGIYRYNGSSWTLFADTSTLSGTGPHGFAFDPVNSDLYLAFQTGEIQRFNGTSGAYLNQIDTISTKLTDVFFKRTVPAPGTAALLGLGGLALTRRRR